MRKFLYSRKILLIEISRLRTFFLEPLAGSSSDTRTMSLTIINSASSSFPLVVLGPGTFEWSSEVCCKCTAAFLRAFLMVVRSPRAVAKACRNCCSSILIGYLWISLEPMPVQFESHSNIELESCVVCGTHVTTMVLSPPCLSLFLSLLFPHSSNKMGSHYERVMTNSHSTAHSFRN